VQQPALQSDLPQGFAAMVLPTHAMHARQFGLLGSGLLIVQSALQEGFAPSTYDVLVEMRGILADGMGDTSLMLRECELVFSPPVDVSVKKPPKREPSWAKRAPAQPPPINAEEVAYMALCSPKHVYDLCSQPGAIPHFRRGRRITFDRAEIQAWLDGFKVG
jgi:hypothetical protein